MALDEALERALKAYDQERLHPAPTNVVAQNIGYKGISSGTALSALASLRYYGLLERPSDGFLAVSKDVEAYQYAPSADLKRSFLFNFLRKPPLFAELLDKFASGLPSDANLKYELIQRGFLPATASSVVIVMRRSVDFAGYFDKIDEGFAPEAPEARKDVSTDESSSESLISAAPTSIEKVIGSAERSTPLQVTQDGLDDRIPVRLSGGRRAWLTIPTPFFAADKLRLKAQIDLLLTAEDEE
jgi:hypothetical protein